MIKKQPRKLLNLENIDPVIHFQTAEPLTLIESNMPLSFNGLNSNNGINRSHLTDSEENDSSDIGSIPDGEDEEADISPIASSFFNSMKAFESIDLQSVDAETRARLQVLFEATGIVKMNKATGCPTDQKLLRKLTSSVSEALSAAAAAATKNNDGLTKACMAGDANAARMLLKKGHSANQLTEDGDSLLSMAASSGYYELCQVLLATNANVDDRGTKGDCTPLMEAAGSGYVDVIRLLISNGADVNAKSTAGNTALHYAASGGHKEVVLTLIKNGGSVEASNENGHTPLMEAASVGHVSVAELLMDNGAGVNTHSSEFKESALTLACYKGHVEMVELLLNRGGDLEHKTDEMHTPLMEACIDGFVDVATILIEHGAQVNMPADSFESPLTLASCGGHVELASLLLDKGADVDERNDEGYTPLMEAAREGHTEISALLLDHGANIDAITEETRETALTLACCGGFLEMAEFLIKEGANLELGGSTPLMEAAQENHVYVVKYLLALNVKVDAVGQMGDTALSCACENGNLDVVKILHEAGANINHESEGGRTPLMKAARSGHLSTVQYLVSLGANVNKETTNNDQTVLSLACVGGHLEVVEFLLKHGADVTHKLKDGSTMLIEAARGGHTSIVTLLLDYSKLNHEALPLTNECANSNLSLSPRTGGDGCHSKEEVDSSKDALSSGSSSETAVRGAAMLGLLSKVDVDSLSNAAIAASAIDGCREAKAKEQLREVLSSIMKVDLWKLSAEEQAVKRQQIRKVLQMLDGEKSTIDEVLSEHADQQTIPQKSTVAASGSDVRRDGDGSSGIDSAVHDLSSSPPTSISSASSSEAFEDACCCLLHTSLPSNPTAKKTADVAQSTIATANQVSPHNRVFAVEGHRKLASPTGKQLSTDKLISSTFNLDKKDSILEHAHLTTHNLEMQCQHVCMGNHTLQQALKSPLKNNNRLSPTPQEIVQRAQQIQRQKAALVQSSAAINLTSKLMQGRNGPMECNHNNNNLSRIHKPKLSNLIADAKNNKTASLRSQTTQKGGPKKDTTNSRAPIEVNAQTEANHDTALTLASAGGHAELVELLLLRGADVEHRDKKGFTSLILAAAGGHVQVVSMLLDRGADIEAQLEQTKDTALSLACSGGRQEVVELLLRNGANREHRNASDYTPLCLAASGGHIGIIHLLLKNGAEINSRTGSRLGISPLMLASMNGHVQAVSLLLDKGGDVNAQIETNRNTALTLACYQGRHEVVALLADRRANLEHRAKKGLTPLMESAAGGYVDVGRVLLDRGADVTAVHAPSTRDTALTIAADKGHYRFVELLICRGAQVDSRNKKGQSALWLACNGGHLELAQLLVGRKADIDAADNRRVSCLMAAFKRGHVKIVRWLSRHGAQLPSNQECTRTIAACTGNVDLARKCRQCLEIVHAAKERQAAEANRCADNLLQELAIERSQVQNKRAAAARKREKRKQKKKKNGQMDADDDALDSKDAANDGDEESNDENDSMNAMAPQQENNEVNDDVKPILAERNAKPKSENRRSRKKNGSGASKFIVEKMEDAASKDEEAYSALMKNLSLQSAASDEQWSECRRLDKKNPTNAVSSLNGNAICTSNIDSLDDFTIRATEIQQPISAPKQIITTSLPQPPQKPGKSIGGVTTKMTTKKDELWKEVSRKCRKMIVPAKCISRIIGRGGCNINAIRELSGAHIDLDKSKSSIDGIVTIKGSQESVQLAHQLFDTMIAEPERDIMEIIFEIKGDIAKTAKPVVHTSNTPTESWKPVVASTSKPVSLMSIEAQAPTQRIASLSKLETINKSQDIWRANQSSYSKYFDLKESEISENDSLKSSLSLPESTENNMKFTGLKISGTPPPLMSISTVPPPPLARPLPDNDNLEMPIPPHSDYSPFDNIFSQISDSVLHLGKKGVIQSTKISFSPAIVSVGETVSTPYTSNNANCNVVNLDSLQAKAPGYRPIGQIGSGRTNIRASSSLTKSLDGTDGRRKLIFNDGHAVDSINQNILGPGGIIPLPLDLNDSSLADMRGEVNDNLNPEAQPYISSCINMPNFSTISSNDNLLVTRISPYGGHVTVHNNALPVTSFMELENFQQNIDWTTKNKIGDAAYNYFQEYSAFGNHFPNISANINQNYNGDCFPDFSESNRDLLLQNYEYMAGLQPPVTYSDTDMFGEEAGLYPASHQLAASYLPGHHFEQDGLDFMSNAYGMQYSSSIGYGLEESHLNQLPLVDSNLAWWPQ